MNETLPNRLARLKAEQTAKQLKACDQMLTSAGVPEWVVNASCEGVPSNSTPSRLKWFLVQRKDVAQKEMFECQSDDCET